MMTDDALIARLRETLDELTAPSAPATQPVEVPDLDTVTVPLTDLSTPKPRWMATAAVIGIAAATLAVVVITRAPSDQDESAGTRPAADPIPTVVTAERTNGGIPTFTVDLPGAKVAFGPQLQKSGSQAGVHRQVFTAPDGTDERVLVVASYPNDAQAYGADEKSFEDSELDSPESGVREFRSSRSIDGTGPQIAEFLSIGDTRSTWIQARGFSEIELARLVNGAIREGSDGSFVLADAGLNLVDIGASAYGSGELWWSRFADYDLADGSRVNVSVSTGTAADRFNDALGYATEMLDLNGASAYRWSNKLVNNAGQAQDMWGSTDPVEDARSLEWHDDVFNVVVRVRGNVRDDVLLEVANALRLAPVP